ncbi:trichohyalin-like [Montipora capricornis]|uniref:trichohyalin-like n=1 Tax=Montipora capricornis TaxID=246305 RepID=UPI0035F1139E
MVCSKADNKNQISMNSSTNERESIRPLIQILTPDGETIKMSMRENTVIRRVKTECELLCGIPSDLLVIQLQDRDLRNDDTLSSLNITEGCTLKLTVPQWWQKFISTCYKGDTNQLRKSIHVKMSEISREERSFTAAFIASVKGNHSLMFSAFAGRKINLLSKTKLSGRNLLHAAVYGGSTSCVANILMNGGNALLDAPDEKGETPVGMAERIYGIDGDMVKFLNIYLELHRRETNQSGDSKCFWDNLEKHNDNSGKKSTNNERRNDDGCDSSSTENGIHYRGDQTLEQGELMRPNFEAKEILTNQSDQSFSTVSKINVEDYEARTCDNALVNVNDENVMNTSGSELCNAHASDTGYYSSGSHSTVKDGTKIIWNEDLFTQKNAHSSESEIIEEVFYSGKQIVVDQADSAANNLSTTAADRKGNSDCESSQWLIPNRRAQLRLIDQKRKRSTTEKPNLEQLMIMRSDNQDNNEREKEQAKEHTNEGKEKEQNTEILDKETPIPTDNLKGQEQGQTSSNRDSSENCSSPKPLRRAQLRKKSIVEQRRRKSIAQRPNIEELENARGNKVEDSENVAENSSQRMAQEKAESENFENTRRHSGNATSARVFGQLREGNIGEGLKRENIEGQLEHLTKGHKKSESLGDESPVSAKYVLRLWQDQVHEAEFAASSAGEECEESHSPEVLRRAFVRKQAYMAQRRKKSATARPDILKLISRNVEWEREDESQATDGCEGNKDNEPSVTENNSSVAAEAKDNSGPQCNISHKQIEEVGQFSQLPQDEENMERIPIRKTHRCPNTGPLLETRTQNTKRGSWSSVSGEESDESDQERVVVAESISPIAQGGLVRTSRRRRLPVIPDKGIKLPVIKIDDSGISRGLTSTTALHPPLERSRSGSTCSEGSVSSAELASERTRNFSESDTTSTPAMFKKTDETKGNRLKLRRRSVPTTSFSFNHQHQQPTIRTRKNSIQVEEIEEQGSICELNLLESLRGKKDMDEEERMDRPWNAWISVRRESVQLRNPAENNSQSVLNSKRKSYQQWLSEKELDHLQKLFAKAQENAKTNENHGAKLQKGKTFDEWLEDKRREIESEKEREKGLEENQKIEEDKKHQRRRMSKAKYDKWLMQKEWGALQIEEKMEQEAKQKHELMKKKWEEEDEKKRKNELLLGRTQSLPLEGAAPRITGITRSRHSIK